MGKIILCTGGCRSGKSGYALSLVNKFAGTKVFVATLEARDAEMSERVRRHQAERARSRNPDGEWITLEVSVRRALLLPDILDAAPKGAALLLDCLSTWVSACMETLALNLPALDAAGREEMILEVFAASLAKLAGTETPAVLVSAEAGLGMVPENSEARLFRDILGRVNQLAASGADEAYFVVSGIPMRLK